MGDRGAKRSGSLDDRAATQSRRSSSSRADKDDSPGHGGSNAAVSSPRRRLDSSGDRDSRSRSHRDTKQAEARPRTPSRRYDQGRKGAGQRPLSRLSLHPSSDTVLLISLALSAERPTSNVVARAKQGAGRQRSSGKEVAGVPSVAGRSQQAGAR